MCQRVLVSIPADESAQTIQLTSLPFCPENNSCRNRSISSTASGPITITPGTSANVSRNRWLNSSANASNSRSFCVFLFPFAISFSSRFLIILTSYALRNFHFYRLQFAGHFAVLQTTLLQMILQVVDCKIVCRITALPRLHLQIVGHVARQVHHRLFAH